MDVLHLPCHFADFFKYNVLILFRLGDLDDWLVVLPASLISFSESMIVYLVMDQEFQLFYHVTLF